MSVVLSRRVLLLDVMGTLVHDPFYVEVPAFFGMSLGELVAAKDPHAWPWFEAAAIDEAELQRRFFQDGRAFDFAGLKQAMAGAYALLPGIEALLGELSAAGVEMHALSNYPCWFQLIEERLALSRWISWTFVSCKTGLRKPAPSTYRHALGALGVVATDALFVDDREDNCAAARGEGLAALRFTDAATLREALAESGWLRVRPGSEGCGRGAGAAASPIEPSRRDGAL